MPQFDAPRKRKKSSALKTSDIPSVRSARNSHEKVTDVDIDDIPKAQPKPRKANPSVPTEIEIIKKKSKGKKKIKKNKAYERDIHSMPPTSPARAGKKVPEKKKHKKNMTIYYFLLVLLTVGVLAALSVTVLFNVDNIVIEGETAYTYEQLVEAGGIETGVNLIRYDNGAAEKMLLDKLVYIDKVEVKKSFPSTLTVVVESAVPLADILYDGKYYVISHKGRILEKRDTPSGIVVIKGYEPLETEVGSYISAEDEAKTSALYAITEKLEELDFTGIKEIDITDRLGITMSYEDRVKVVLGNIGSLEDKLTVGKVILKEQVAENEKVILILTDPTRVVVRPYYSEEIAEELAQGSDETDSEDMGDNPDEAGEQPDNNSAEETQAAE